MIDVVEAFDAAPTPERAPAVRHPSGYLEVDALLARDGLLRYSDGRDAWIEYRPRAELERAADSWAHKPVTDNHPSHMVTADTWASVARGVVLDGLTVEGPMPDGVSYLRGRILITDAALIRKIDAGQREVSIGFTTAVIPARDGVAPDGTRCDGVQTDMAGDHLASVPRGRAGPAVRVLMDGEEIPVYDDRDHAGREEDPHVKNPTTKIPQPAGRADEVGAPTTEIMVVGPDGQKVPVPTWVLGELQMVREALAKAMGGEAPAAPAAAKPEPPKPAGGDAPENMPAAPAPDDDEKDEDEMTPDAIQALVRRHTRLVRLATTAGVDASKIEAADSAESLAREFIAAKAPYLKARADAAEGAILDALVDAVAEMPAPKVPAEGNPFERGARGDAAREDALTKDPIAGAISSFMAAQGYAA